MLKDGRLVESGNHFELLAKDGEYRRLLYHFKLFSGHSHKDQCQNGNKLFVSVKFGLAGTKFGVTAGRVPYSYIVDVSAV